MRNFSSPLTDRRMIIRMRKRVRGHRTSGAGRGVDNLLLEDGQHLLIDTTNSDVLRLE